MRRPRLTPWRLLRATARVTLAGLSTVTALVVLLPAVPVGYVSLRARTAWNSFIFRAWSRFNLALAGARLEVRGTPPRAPFFLVSNHLSYVDVLVLASRLDVVFVAKAQIRDWPLMGWVCRLVRTVFIQREMKRDLPRVLGEIEDRMRHGQGVVVFPEGTSSAGSGVPPFRPPLLELAARGELPVDYASLAYRALPGEDPAGTSICWWADMTFPDHFFHLLAMPGFEATLTFGSEPIRASDRKQLARRLHEAVVTIFEPSAPQHVRREDV